MTRRISDFILAGILVAVAIVAIPFAFLARCLKAAYRGDVMIMVMLIIALIIAIELALALYLLGPSGHHHLHHVDTRP
jgi:MFS-type transporter involved in bile tolerance (Atg22 family)